MREILKEGVIYVLDDEEHTKKEIENAFADQYKYRNITKFIRTKRGGVNEHQ